MSYETDITTETEREAGYTISREVQAIGNTCRAYVTVKHGNQSIGLFDSAATWIADAQAHDFTADDMASRKVAEADAQAEIDAMLGEVPGALSYADARALNSRRELGAALLSLTDAQMEATARNIVTGAGRGQPWADALVRLEALRAEAAMTAMANSLASAANQSTAEVDALAAGLRSVNSPPSVRTIHLDDCGDRAHAVCPYCGGYALLADDRNDGNWTIKSTCPHVDGMDTFPWGLARFVLPEPTKPNSAAEFGTAVKAGGAAGAVMADAFRKMAQPQQQSEWIELKSWGPVRPKGMPNDQVAFCPYCSAILRYSPDDGGVDEACVHAVAIDLDLDKMQAEFTNPGPERNGQPHYRAVKILPEQAPTPSEIGRAISMANKMGLDVNADPDSSSISDLDPDAYAAAIKAARALGYDRPGHIFNLTEPQFIAAVQAIAAMEGK